MRKSVSTLVIAWVIFVGGIGSDAHAPDKAGPSANGTFQFTVGDGSVRYVSFDARILKDNKVTGEMTYTDPSASPEVDTDSGDSASTTTGLSVKASFDCLVINGNRAVMSGVIVESNVGAALGRRVLLVVEDNEQGINALDLDKLSWGVYKPHKMDWNPADAELENDTGASTTTGLSVKASFDCLVINGNRAVMSGVIVESNVGAALGRRVLLVVEDNEQGINALDLDKLSWGVYKPHKMDWNPADAELENDTGA